jgi:hypothetical protein
MEVAVDHVLDACSLVDYVATDSEASCSAIGDSDLDSQPDYLVSSPSVTAVVRKELATSIRDLVQHGMVQVRRSLDLHIV